MANTGYSSPFPTSHDAVGLSTQFTPLVMPSSPPVSAHEGDSDNLDLHSSPEKSPAKDRVAARTRAGYEFNEEEIDEARQRELASPALSRATSPDHDHDHDRDHAVRHNQAVRDIDARLAEYSVDFSRLGGGDKDDDLLLEMNTEDDKVSDVGGPEDFTANMEKYLMGEDEDDDQSVTRQLEEDLAADFRKRQEEEEAQEEQGEQHAQEQSGQKSNSQHTTNENDAELGEYSEFGPPVDISTPSHFLHKAAGGLAKDATHLEDIEEGSDDEMDAAATPSIRKHKDTRANGEDDGDLRQQIAELQQALRSRDEELDKSHEKVLEATSASAQVKHLQEELKRKESLEKNLQDELREHRDEVQLLWKQHEERDESSKELAILRSSMNAADVGALKSKITEMQKELQNRNSTDKDAVTHLRQELSSTHEQLRKRNETLDETMGKLREVAAAKEQQLREKNTEIDGLRAQMDDQALEIEKLESDIERANTDYQALEDRIISLETQNRPLEEKNTTLEADLTRAQSQVTAHENALKAIAADRSPGAGGQETFTEILDLINNLNPQEGDTQGNVSRDPREDEMQRLRQEVASLQGELNQTSSVRKTLEAELARSREHTAERQSLFKSIEDENSRLSKRADDLKSRMERAQLELTRLRSDHAAALQTIERLQQESTIQQPSPPPSPPTAHTANQRQPSIAQPNTSPTTQNLQTLLSTAQKRETLLRTELQTLRTTSTSQEAEIQRLHMIIEAKDETAVTLDERIARSVEKREKEWERRVELLLNERERMGRALMWTWGEKEVGDKGAVFDKDGRKVRQGYRYKYADAGKGQKGQKG